MFARKSGATAAGNAPPTFQPGPVNLPIGAANDSFEREADRAAEAVTGKTGLDWSISKIGINAPLQRQCACGGSSSQEGQCESCKQKKLLRRATGSSGQAAAPPVLHEVLGSPGHSLDDRTRAYFEPRFGHDFSKVRVHTDARAAESAHAVNALAYTVGSDIVFGKSLYPPGTASGRNLLAHELAHTIQQSAGGRPSLQRQVDGDESTDQEQEQEVNEPHDGDTAVITSASGATEENLKTGGDLADLGELAQNSPEEMQAGNKKPEAKPKEKKKDNKKLAPTPPPTSTSIDVDLSSQQMTVHYSDNSTEGHAIASGKGKPGTKDDPCKTQTEENCTPTGDFKIASKGDKNTTNQHGDKMAWYVDLGVKDSEGKNRGIGIHNSQPVGGGPRSHGCVRVGDSAADEAFAKKINKGVDDQTVVHITGKASTKPWGTPPAPKKKAAPKEKKK
jgi:lipoprotein-anchoring transpeptidase ErfK/SrfK